MLKARVFKRGASSYNASKMLRKYPVGQEIHGFEIKRVLPVPELSYTAVNLRHNVTGLDYLHIDRKDPNNVFLLCFKTNPTDLTGLPHILEHTTLCGSDKYPVRDPFFKMLNRSLLNFMNAMTGHDYTFYPFSTTNAKDYENLRSIYFDACFNPLLSSQDFYQEGWRLEHADPKDPTTPIVFKGVVYNEMKGQFSNSSYLFYISFLNKIYPSLHISGGDPRKITDLVHADLVDFHRSRYHPSNAKVFSYGDLPLEGNLQFLDKHLIGFGNRSKGQSDIRKPIDLSKNQEVVVTGPVDPTLPEDRQYKASLTWALGHPDDVYGSFVARMTSNLLLDGHASPFFKKLIEGGLGYDFSVNSGADSTTDLTLFTVGLLGLNEADIPKFEQACHEILVEKAETGFDDSKVQALLRQIELLKKDKKADFGLNMLSALVPGWVNKVDPFDLLAFDDILTQFKEEYGNAKDTFFQNYIKENLVNKPVFKFVMKPDPQYEQKVAEEEAARLKKKVDALDENDREVIYKRGLYLLEQQTKEEDLSCLPTLSVEKDIAKTGQTFPTSDNGQIFTRVTDSNGLLYFRGQKDLTGLVPAELVPYLPLFCECLLNLGTEDKTMDELEDQIKMYTGGLSLSVSVKPSPVNNLQPKVQWEIRGVALNGDSEHIYDLWSELINGVNLNNIAKLQTLIKSMNSNSVSEIASSGHSYARSLACLTLSPVKELGEHLNGLSQIRFLSKMNAVVENEDLLRSEVISKLEQIKAILGTKNKFRFGLIGDASGVKQNEAYVSKFLSSLPEPVKTSSLDYTSEDFFKELRKVSGEGELGDFTSVQLPYQVSYALLGVMGTSYLTKDSAALQVLSQLLTFKYLHKEVREKGGAYGGGARYGGVDGTFGYYSYRDPQPIRSIEYFKKSAYFGAENAWAKENLDEAKLTLFQGIDAPMDVKSEGMILFRDGITDEMRQQRRENLLEVDSEDVRNVAERYLVGALKESKYKVAVIGPKLEDYDEEKWKTIKWE